MVILGVLLKKGNFRGGFSGVSLSLMLMAYEITRR